MSRGRAPWPRPAQPWRGEPGHDLWHFSEDPTIAEFVPRPSARPNGRRLVWAVDTRHSPLFWFPRDCPRITFWAAPWTSASDRRRFLGREGATRVHCIEAAFVPALVHCRLVAYRLPVAAFRPDPGAAGYWTAEKAVRPLEMIEVGDLRDKHAGADIELRVLPSVWPLWHHVIRSTLGFSWSRLANSTTPQPADLLV